MKKTRMMLSNLSDVNYNIESLEESGWEVVNFKDINFDREVWILLMAQKESDKSIYEKMYLLEKYCETREHCTKCKIDSICDENECSSPMRWDFEDVEKAYEVIRDGDR